MEKVQIFEAEDCGPIFDYLNQKEIEYHKPYKRFNKMVKVPRGQASYTLNEDIHYDYGVSGGSPPNEVMCDRLKEITAKVNDALGTNFNTILMNVYKNGDDCIGFHKDNEKGWAPYTGFATLAFGAERDFLIKRIEDNETTVVSHTNGSVIHLPYPMNHNHLHSIPKRKKVKDTRISLTFREIVNQ